MNEILKFSIIGICLLIVIVCAIVIINSVTRKRLLEKMNSDIEDEIKSICSTIESSSYEKFNNQSYDYLIKTSITNYYIKIIDNRSNNEICINNATKWQIRKSFNDTSLNFVPNVEEFMRKELNGKKIFIIYPNARSLLKYINECEMIIVRSDTDIYGTNVITYAELKENNKLIK